MKESIIIKNFGPLKEVEIDDIKPLTVFIGKSAGGKSIIMKVIVLMRYIYKMVNIRSYLKNAKITRSPFKLRFIIRKSKFPQNPKRSVRFSGKRTKRSVQKRKARNTQKAETKVL